MLCMRLGWRIRLRLVGRRRSRRGKVVWPGLCRSVLLGRCIGSRRRLFRLSSLRRSGCRSLRVWLLLLRGWGCFRWLLVGLLLRTIRGGLVGAGKLAGRILSVGMPWRMGVVCSCLMFHKLSPALDGPDGLDCFCGGRETWVGPRGPQKFAFLVQNLSQKPVSNCDFRKWVQR